MIQFGHPTMTMLVSSSSSLASSNAALADLHRARAVFSSSFVDITPHLLRKLVTLLYSAAALWACTKSWALVPKFSKATVCFDATSWSNCSNYSAVPTPCMADSRKKLSKPNPQNSAAWNTPFFSDSHLLTEKRGIFLVISFHKKLAICWYREVIPRWPR